MQLAVTDASGVGAARRHAKDQARLLGFDETLTGRLELIVTEAASNLVKHAGGGEILLDAVREEPSDAIHVLALDRGPGIANLSGALLDGYSSAGSPGTGLGAISRLASAFDVFTRSGGGSAVFASIDRRPLPAKGLIAGGVSEPYPGESVCGDSWAVVGRSDGSMLLLVADGLGHGDLAHTAAEAAVSSFRSHAALSPAEVLTRIHEALRPTRGAAVAVVEVDPERGVVRFAGIGNIAGTILANGSTRSVVSMHGTAGHDVRRIQEFSYPWTQGARLVMHSDGLISHWTLDSYPGLLERHPVLIAGILYRDFRRGRDDITVVVLRDAT